MTSDASKGTFWDHLDILRTAIIKMIAVWSVVSIVAFIFKNELFDILLAPATDDFVTYRLIDTVCLKLGFDLPAKFDIQLINTGLAQQFIIHMQAAMCAGLVLTAPYALYLIFAFVSPGLYRKEKKYVSGLLVSGYLMFMVGIILSYFIIFPLTFQFLGTYQVATDVVNMISLESYMGTLVMMCLCLGVIFELPVMSWLFAKLGLLKTGYMSRYRKHAIVLILTVAAVITPTSDIFTLLLVSVPIWLLYELSIRIVRQTTR